MMSVDSPQEDAKRPNQAPRAKFGSLPVVLFLLLMMAGGLYVIVELSQKSGNDQPEFFFDGLFERRAFVEPIAISISDAESSVTLRKSGEDWRIVGFEEAQIARDPLLAYLQRISSLRYEEALLLGPKTEFLSGTQVELRTSTGKTVAYSVTSDNRVVLKGGQQVFRAKGLMLSSQPKAWVTRTLSMLTPGERPDVSKVSLRRGDAESVVEIERSAERDWRFVRGADGLAHRGRSELLLSTLYGFRVLDYRKEGALTDPVEVALDLKQSQRAFRVEQPKAGEPHAWLQFKGERGAYLIEAAIARVIAPTLAELKGEAKRGHTAYATTHDRPNTVALAVIVVGYQGLEWPQTVSSTSRSRADALAFARELHFRIDSRQASFEALAREESDFLDPNDPYGKVTSYGPYALAEGWIAEVDAAAGELELGELHSGVIETSRGFFIIQRIE